MKIYIYCLFLLVITYACITPIDNFEQVAGKQYLVVEAFLNNQPEVQRVRLYYSSDKLVGGNFLPVLNAKIYFTDEKGVRENLTDASDGNYVTSANFQGRVGGSYRLNIELTDGKKYQSQLETMKPVPALENVITRFEIQDNFDKKDPRRAGFNVYTDLQDSPTLGDNYQWSWKHYERAPICESCFEGKFDFVLNRCVTLRNPQNRTLNYRCDGNCWDINFSTDLNVFSDTYLNGQRITGKQVARVPYDDTSPYYLQLEQRSITQSSYNYYQGLVNQNQNNGTLFDIPAETRFSYNIVSLTNPDEKILGIFDVHSVSRKAFYIDRINGVPKDVLPIRKIITGTLALCVPFAPPEMCPDRVPCVEGLYRTVLKPDGWKD